MCLFRSIWFSTGASVLGSSGKILSYRGQPKSLFHQEITSTNPNILIVKGQLVRNLFAENFITRFESTEGSTYMSKFQVNTNTLSTQWEPPSCLLDTEVGLLNQESSMIDKNRKKPVEGRKWAVLALSSKTNTSMPNINNICSEIVIQTIESPPPFDLIFGAKFQLNNYITGMK